MKEVINNKYVPTGYMTFPQAVHFLFSHKHPGKTMTLFLFQELGDPLCKKLHDERLKAYLLVRPPRVDASRRSKRPHKDVGKLFPVAPRYWNTDNAEAAKSGRWVEAPVLEPQAQPSGGTGCREVIKGGLVLLEEKAIEAETRQWFTARAEKAAEEQVRAQMVTFHRGQGHLPVKTQWKREICEQIKGLSERAADRAWSKVREDYPELGSPAGKSKKRNTSNR